MKQASTTPKPRSSVMVCCRLRLLTTAAAWTAPAACAGPALMTGRGQPHARALQRQGPGGWLHVAGASGVAVPRRACARPAMAGRAGGCTSCSLDSCRHAPAGGEGASNGASGAVVAGAGLWGSGRVTTARSGVMYCSVPFSPPGSRRY